MVEIKRNPEVDNCYLIFNREYTFAEYLYSVRDMKQRVTLTKYRPDDHKTRHRQILLPREEPVCCHSSTGEVEKVVHFLLH